jgi:hypothetical protein
MTSAPPDTVTIPATTAQQIVNVLSEHVGNFSCAHDLGICFCQERQIIRELKEALEAELFVVQDE